VSGAVTAPRALLRRAGAAVALAALATGCAGVLSSPGSASPPPTSQRAPVPGTRPVDGAQAQRLQRVMVPLVRAMDNPLPLDRVRVGIIDDNQINAANAGGGEFYVTRGLLEKAGDRQLAGVLAHEIAHDDLKHVAKAQALGAGLSIGTIILDQVFPGSGAVTPIAGQLIARRYSQREEYAADQHGADLLQKAGLPREVMADTLAWLMQTAGGSSGGFFATHPATTDRIEALRRPR
jgi:Zn-dependent protease with chaperone function